MTPSTVEDDQVRVLVVSSWQTVNIGDVAHSPGALAALTRFAPNAEITLLAMNLDDRERIMFARHFPDVRLVESGGWNGQNAMPERIAAEFDRADVLVHGCGPSVVVPGVITAWRERSSKPYGFFGITVDPFPGVAATLAEMWIMIGSARGDLLGQLRELLDHAAFIYCRDSLTRDLMLAQGIRAGVIEFGPDATVTFDAYRPQPMTEALAPLTGSRPLRRAEPLLCVVPRLRYTPYHQIRKQHPTLKDRRRDAYNAAYRDRELDVLDTAIQWWLTHTTGSVLVVPEMSYAMELAASRWTSTDRLHVLSDFWDLSDAAAVYAEAAAVVSMECHSPLIALAVGTPAMYVRQPTDTIKGQMYDDLGLSEAIAEIDEDAIPRIQHWLAAATNPEVRRRTADARDLAIEQLARMSRAVEAVARTGSAGKPEEVATAHTEAH